MNVAGVQVRILFVKSVFTFKWIDLRQILKTL